MVSDQDDILAVLADSDVLYLGIMAGLRERTLPPEVVLAVMKLASGCDHHVAGVQARKLLRFLAS